MGSKEETVKDWGPLSKHIEDPVCKAVLCAMANTSQALCEAAENHNDLWVRRREEKWAVVAHTNFGYSLELLLKALVVLSDGNMKRIRRKRQGHLFSSLWKELNIDNQARVAEVYDRDRLTAPLVAMTTGMDGPPAKRPQQVLKGNSLEEVLEWLDTSVCTWKVKYYYENLIGVRHYIGDLSSLLALVKTCDKGIVWAVPRIVPAPTGQ